MCKSCHQKYDLTEDRLNNFKERGYLTFKGHKHSEDAKLKIGKSHKGKIISKETKDKIRKSRKGKILSKETKDKMSKSHKGKIWMHNDYISIKVDSNNSTLINHKLNEGFVYGRRTFKRRRRK